MDVGQVNEMIKIGMAVWACCIMASLPALARTSDSNPYMQCMERPGITDVDSCRENAGRGEWRPSESLASCKIVKQMFEFADRKNWKLSWDMLFMNERCRRNGETFYDRANQR